MDLIIAVLIIIAIQLVSFLVLRGRIHQDLNATSLLKDVRDEVDGMVRELNLSAERNIGLLEARIEEMETLLAQADQKLVLLAREIERRDKTADVYSQLKRVVVEASPELKPEPEAEPEPRPSPEPVLPFPPSPAPEPTRPRSLKEKVLAYREQGADAGAIAAATGATRAEVELILSLNPRA
jgi:hypothetical protein